MSFATAMRRSLKGQPAFRQAFYDLEQQEALGLEAIIRYLAEEQAIHNWLHAGCAG